MLLQELNRLMNVSKNKREKEYLDNTIITSLNVRSLINNHEHVLIDPRMKSDVIALQETWCGESYNNDRLSLPGYQMHLVSQGRGKGVATYFKSGFKITGSIRKELYQISKVSCKDYDIINLYRSQGSNKEEFLRDLGSLARGARPCFIVGDFNIDFLKEKNHPIVRKITDCGFMQLVASSTHKEGGLLDHVYVRKVPYKLEICLNTPYYSDHSCVSIVKMLI